MQTIAQTITQTITETRKEIKEYPVPSFWKYGKYYPKYYAIISPDCVMLVTTTTTGEHPAVSIMSGLFDDDILEVQIQADEFSAVYEAAQIQITDAFQTAFPETQQLVDLLPQS